MYNLFVSGNEEAWKGQPWEIELGRCLESTAAPLVEKYRALDDSAATALKNYPSIFAYETANRQPARIGWITRVRHRANRARIEYELEQALPAIPHERLLELQWDLDLSDWEMNRTHWALKDVDLFPVLVEAGILDAAALRAQLPGSRIARHGLGQTPDIEARPRVFRIPASPPEPDLVSVMMPFAPQFNVVYATLGVSCAQLGLRCERADNVWQENEIIQDIFSLIYRSKIVICDFTGQNPNVFYEAGIAHTLGKSVVPIAQGDHDVPFDLRHHRYIRYLNNGEGLAALSQKLLPRLRTLRDLP